jgi:hypothetical protein
MQLGGCLGGISLQESTQALTPHCLPNPNLAPFDNPSSVIFTNTNPRRPPWRPQLNKFLYAFSPLPFRSVTLQSAHTPSPERVVTLVLSRRQFFSLFARAAPPSRRQAQRRPLSSSFTPLAYTLDQVNSPATSPCVHRIHRLPPKNGPFALEHHHACQFMHAARPEAKRPSRPAVRFLTCVVCFVGGGGCRSLAGWRRAGGPHAARGALAHPPPPPKA